MDDRARVRAARASDGLGRVVQPDPAIQFRRRSHLHHLRTILCVTGAIWLFVRHARGFDALLSLVRSRAPTSRRRHRGTARRSAYQKNARVRQTVRSRGARRGRAACAPSTSGTSWHGGMHAPARLGTPSASSGLRPLDRLGRPRASAGATTEPRWSTTRCGTHGWPTGCGCCRSRC